MKIRNLQIMLNKETKPYFIDEIEIETYYDHDDEKSLNINFYYNEKLLNSTLIPEVNDFIDKIINEYSRYTKYFIYSRLIKDK